MKNFKAIYSINFDKIARSSEYATANIDATNSNELDDANSSSLSLCKVARVVMVTKEETWLQRRIVIVATKGLGPGSDDTEEWIYG